MIYLYEKEITKFWSKVDKASGECWIWAGLRSGGQRLGGYGIFTISRKHDHTYRNRYAHIVSFCISRGYPVDYVPAGIEVRHMCHNHLCCNPCHLELGTHAQNIQDTYMANRQARGTEVGSAKLTEEDVLNIRSMLASGMTHKIISEQFRVSRATVTYIHSGRNWGWL